MAHFPVCLLGLPLYKLFIYCIAYVTSRCVCVVCFLMQGLSATVRLIVDVRLSIHVFVLFAIFCHSTPIAVANNERLNNKTEKGALRNSTLKKKPKYSTKAVRLLKYVRD